MMRLAAAVCMLALTTLPIAGQDWSARAGVISLATHRNATFAGVTGRADATMNGVEVHLERDWIGISARGFGARFQSDSVATGAGKVSYADVRVHAGPELIAADIGYGRRGLSGSLGRRVWSFVRLGALSRIPIGGSGLTAEVALAAYPVVRGSGDFDSGGGGDAETRLTYRPPNLPGYLTLGYRLERFTTRTASEARPEEVSSVFIGLGVFVGSR